MKILFLDIDGVLNRFKLDKIGYFIDLDLVQKLIQIVKRTSCKIVISSSWKYDSTLMDLIDDDLSPMLPDGCIIGCTPNIIPQTDREKEIDLWFQQNQHLQIDSYVVLDDYDFELKHVSKDHCVITNALEGLSDFDVEKCVEILNGKGIRHDTK